MLHAEPCSQNTYVIPVTSTVKLGKSFTYAYASYKGGNILEKLKCRWKSMNMDIFQIFKHKWAIFFISS